MQMIRLMSESISTLFAPAYFVLEIVLIAYPRVRVINLEVIEFSKSDSGRMNEIRVRNLTGNFYQ